MINPSLYAALERRFGEGEVRVFNEGEPLTCEYAQRDDKQNRYRIAPGFTPGEEYRVNCPFCGDTRQRLYINHRWGVSDPKTGTRNLWLAHCWNEECLHDYAKQESLYDQIYTFLLYDDGDYASLCERSEKGAANKKPKTIRLPPCLWYLDDIKAKLPTHKAVQYLEDRLHDATTLGAQWGYAYCSDSNLWQARNRIIIPIYYRNELVGWQGRHIGKPEKDVVKYGTSPGFAKSQHVYNVEHASSFSVVVLTEGAFDVAGVGEQAVCIFGKSLNRAQLTKLEQHMSHDAVLVVMLDPTPDKTVGTKQQKHHIDKTMALLQTSSFAGRCLDVRLLLTMDPGSVDNAYLWDLIEWKAKKIGLLVEKGRPATPKPKKAPRSRSALCSQRGSPRLGRRSLQKP